MVKIVKLSHGLSLEKYVTNYTCICNTACLYNLYTYLLFSDYRSSQLVIADMGCGEAKISQSVPNKVFSFDLVAVNDFVTACDMAKVSIKYITIEYTFLVRIFFQCTQNLTLIFFSFVC